MQPKYPRGLLNTEEVAAVEKAIVDAESQTSGELKLVITRHCWDDIRSKAARLFYKLGLHRTRLRNAVLVLLVMANRQFYIYGDESIHARVGQEFWDDVRDRMSVNFRQGRFADGLCEGIVEIGQKLSHFFPPQANDTNEISDVVGYAE